jgi:hypothetical protein
MDDADPLPKKYTLVRDSNNRLYLVAPNDNEVVDLEASNSPVPANIVTLVHGDLGDVGTAGIERTVETRLTQYLTPHGSGVRVKVPKIFD